MSEDEPEGYNDGIDISEETCRFLRALAAVIDADVKGLIELVVADPEEFTAFLESSGLRDTAEGKTLLKAMQQQARKKEQQVGDRMPDGTIFAGISPDSHQPMYTTPADAPLTFTFNEARNYAVNLNAHGHQDWRVPTKAELNVLWENCEKGALTGTFNQTDPDVWYWSSTEFDEDNAASQVFKNGDRHLLLKFYDLSLRCVR